MSLSDPKTQAVITRFLLVLLITDLPIVAAQLALPTFDWRLLVAGLITGFCGALEKVFSPQLANTILPNAQVMPDTKPATEATVAGLIGASPKP